MVLDIYGNPPESIKFIDFLGEPCSIVYSSAGNAHRLLEPNSTMLSTINLNPNVTSTRV